MNKKAIAKKILIQYSIITVGCILFAMGISFFLDASELASGGVTGIAIILSSVIPLKNMTGIWILILNVPLIIIGAVSFGRYFVLSTLYSTVVSSLLVELFTFLIPYLPYPLPNEFIISGVCGGVLVGLGMGLIYRMGSTTGGTDILVKVLRKRFRYIKIGIISLTIDIIIISISFFIFTDFEKLFYTAIALVVMSLTMDRVIYGTESAKLVYIITDDEHATEMCEKITKELDVGATFIDGTGAYTGNERRIILCAIKKVQYPKLCDYIHEIDPRAFTIVTSAKEVYGEGYKEHNDQ